VRTGEHIQIWQDNWIPSNSNIGIYSNSNGLSANATIDVLIDRDTNWWNLPMVASLFPPAVVA
jgi:hypothetical protein